MFRSSVRKPGFNHPIREVRLAIDKTQWQFAVMFGVSRPYVRDIERGKLTPNDKLCGNISLRLGVAANSLKKKRGMPTALLEERTVALMPARIGEPILRDLRKLRGKARERLRHQITLWKRMLPAMEESAPRKELIQKLQVLLAAAQREQKLRTVLFWLDRWIEDQVPAFNLRTTIRVVAGSAGFDWQCLKKLPLILPIGSLATDVTPPKRQPPVEHRQRAR